MKTAVSKTYSGVSIYRTRDTHKAYLNENECYFEKIITEYIQTYPKLER